MDLDECTECPLCMEPIEADDIHFYPCTCLYQICRFCWNRLRVDENGLCPACRKPYTESPANYKPLTQEELQKIKQKKQKDQQKKQKVTENRKHLANVRVVQRNLVFVVGLSSRLADPEVLKRHEYFGRFGKIHKVVINLTTSYAGSQGPSASAYVTYQKAEDALKAIDLVNNVHVDGRTLKASLGTTKYCSHFMRHQACPKADCMYLHELGDEAASFTKEEMQQCKHQEFEKKLHEHYLGPIKNSESTRPARVHKDSSSEVIPRPAIQPLDSIIISPNEGWPSLHSSAVAGSFSNSCTSYTSNSSSKMSYATAGNNLTQASSSSAKGTNNSSIVASSSGRKNKKNNSTNNSGSGGGGGGGGVPISNSTITNGSSSSARTTPVRDQKRCRTESSSSNAARASTPSSETSSEPTSTPPNETTENCTSSDVQIQNVKNKFKSGSNAQNSQKRQKSSPLPTENNKTKSQNNSKKQNNKQRQPSSKSESNNNEGNSTPMESDSCNQKQTESESVDSNSVIKESTESFSPETEEEASVKSEETATDTLNGQIESPIPENEKVYEIQDDESDITRSNITKSDITKSDVTCLENTQVSSTNSSKNIMIETISDICNTPNVLVHNLTEIENISSSVDSNGPIFLPHDSSAVSNSSASSYDSILNQEYGPPTSLLREDSYSKEQNLTEYEMKLEKEQTYDKGTFGEELGFDPFEETNKALALEMALEQQQLLEKQQHIQHNFNQHKVTEALQTSHNGVAPRRNDFKDLLAGHASRVPPPGFTTGPISSNSSFANCNGGANVQQSLLAGLNGSNSQGQQSKVIPSLLSSLGSLHGLNSINRGPPPGINVINQQRNCENQSQIPVTSQQLFGNGFDLPNGPHNLAQPPPGLSLPPANKQQDSLNTNPLMMKDLESTVRNMFPNINSSFNVMPQQTHQQNMFSGHNFGSAINGLGQQQQQQFPFSGANNTNSFTLAQYQNSISQQNGLSLGNHNILSSLGQQQQQQQNAVNSLSQQQNNLSINHQTALNALNQTNNLTALNSFANLTGNNSTNGLNGMIGNNSQINSAGNNISNSLASLLQQQQQNLLQQLQFQNSHHKSWPGATDLSALDPAIVSSGQQIPDNGRSESPSSWLRQFTSQQNFNEPPPTSSPWTNLLLNQQQLSEIASNAPPQTTATNSNQRPPAMMTNWPPTSPPPGFSSLSPMHHSLKQQQQHKAAELDQNVWFAQFLSNSKSSNIPNAASSLS